MEDEKSLIQNKVLIVLASFIVYVFVVKYVLEGKILHPEVDDCRSEIHAQLDLPSTFSQVDLIHNDDGKNTRVYIEYEASEIDGTSFRGKHICKYSNEEISVERPSFTSQQSLDRLVAAEADLKAVDQ